MKTSAITESVLTLFFIMLVGVYGSKSKIITKELNDGLINLLIKIALPFMILSSFIFTYDDTIKSNVIKTFYYSFLVYVLVIAISYLLLLPIKGDKKIILHFANVFTNTGYIGFPILNSIYGPEGVIYGSIFNMFFVIFMWTYGIILFEDTFDKNALKHKIKDILLNPSIIAIFIGILIMVFNIRINGAVLASIKDIGSIAGPLSMIIIGVILSNIKIRNHFRDWTLYYGIITKLIVIPVVVCLLFRFLEDTSKATNSIIIMTALPGAAMTSVLAENYDMEKEYAAIIVSTTTILSLITIPILIKLIK